MVKLVQSTIKYLIEAEFSADGVVEKPDVVGAIFLGRRKEYSVSRKSISRGV